MKENKYILIGLLSMILSFSLEGCVSKNVSANENIRKISVMKIEDSNYSNQITFSGNVIPIETVNLSFKLDGKLSDVPIQEGNYVQTGEKIASIDINDYSLQANAAHAELEMAEYGISATQAQYDAAVAEYKSAEVQVNKEIPSKVKQAKAQLELTQSTYDRIKALYDAGAMSQSQLDEISAKLTADSETYQQALNTQDVVKLQLEASQQKVQAYASQIATSSAQAQKASVAVEKAGNDLSDTILKSPMNGVILKKIMSTGETVAAGYPVAVIGRTDFVYIEIGVSDQEINLLKKGQIAQVSIYGVEDTRRGSIAEIGSLADSSTRMFPVKILVENKDSMLKPGMIARATLETNSLKSISVPLDSVIQRSNGSVVYIYNPANHTVCEQQVNTGEITGETIQVSSGLKIGQQLVTQGQFLLHNGDTVQLEKEGEK